MDYFELIGRRIGVAKKKKSELERVESEKYSAGLTMLIAYRKKKKKMLCAPGKKMATLFDGPGTIEKSQTCTVSL